MISTPLLGPFSEVHLSVCGKCTEICFCFQRNFRTEKSYGKLAYLFLSKMPGGFQECVLPVNLFCLSFIVDRDFLLNVNLFK